MAHFEEPDGSQIVPDCVVFYEKKGDPEGPQELWKIDVPTGTKQVTVSLYGAAGLTVTSNNEAVVPNPISGTVDGDNRILRFAGASAGTSMIEVTDARGAHWVHLQVHVVDPAPNRASTQGPTPRSASADPAAAGTAAQEPVVELLGLIDKQFTEAQLADVKNTVVGFLFARKAANIVQVFLHGFRALAGRNLPTRNAVFLPCHTFEAGFGAVEPNASIGNWFSVQVLPTGSTQPLFEAFKRRGAAPKFGDRDNAGAPSGVFNPDFRFPGSSKINIPAMINAELDLQYGVPADASVQPWVVEAIAPWKGIGLALARTDITARQFGAEIGRSGYAGGGSGYGTTIAAAHGHVSGALKKFLAPSGASATAKAWAAAALANMAPQG